MVRVAYNILKSTVCRRPTFMKDVFVSHVRPIIDFSSVVWNTGYVGDVMKLERIQRRWTKKIDGFDVLSLRPTVRG